ncbi:phospholipid-transporting ATPase 1 [Mycena metata]|uniref:Phospholipid-transporting ATPase n=1 Tax=Mycena metata TaxID=1033252 RepID=A0AAD7K5Z4_9AGAR|nr:phospholipid-transporting ATPase 1 [Mycena metata]
MSSLKRPPAHLPHDDNDTDDDDQAIDPELRLRTVRTAHSAIAESIVADARQTRRRRTFFRRRGEKERERKLEGGAPRPEGRRRNVYVNTPLPRGEVDAGGDPVVRYPRNKVRTTKYTILTFIPRNLYEQFRRIANLFFLTTVVVQLFPVFGAASGAVAVLPLAFILTATAIKDGVEDYRRGLLDEEVNNSPTTRLLLPPLHNPHLPSSTPDRPTGNPNPNLPRDGRSWVEKLLSLNRPGSVSKGVRNLRAREAKGELGGASESTLNVDARSVDVGGDTRSLASTAHSYPPPAVLDPNMRPGAAQWERTLWKKLEVGDIVLLREDEQVPADILVLATSDPDGNCYLETKNLDGETNLKIHLGGGAYVCIRPWWIARRRVVNRRAAYDCLRKSLSATRGLSSAEEDVQRVRFVLDSEPPSQNLYLYHGVLRYRDFSAGAEGAYGGVRGGTAGGGAEDRAEPVSINELLLRGCALRNTAWVVGLVVFTGADTKIMLNGGETPSKQSKIERETNFNVAVNFGVLLAMCVVDAIFSGLEDARTDTSARLFEQGTDPTSVYVLNALVTFVVIAPLTPRSSCIIAFQNIIPISLYISIEIVKSIQAYFISQDIEMYYQGYDTPCVPKTWNISDDLGQIEYVFSDKTGTLTQNVMEFQKCSVNGIAYGEGVTEAQRGAATRAEQADTMDPQELTAKLAGLKQLMVTTMERAWTNRYLESDALTLVSPALASALADRASPERAHITAFFRALALCHSVLAEQHGGGGVGAKDDVKTPVRVQYKAESPDEAALVGAARDVGFVFVNKGRELVEIQVLGEAERWTLLRVLEFNSTRKRQSCVYRAPDGKLVMYCKGADSVVYARLAADHDPVLKEATRRDMEAFANNGLRTLCVAWRVLSQEEYSRWGRVYDEATNRVDGRDEAIEAACEQLEQNLTILGATALEDKLQEGVPEAIEMLHRAGIKLWILTARTGDKLQTAIEIGYSCNLLKADMDLMILSADSQQQARAQIEAGLNKIASVLGPPSWDPRKRGFVPGAQAAFAVVIDGDTLTHALSPELKEMFLNLGTQCETVVCCRVSPAQKALTVKLVKEGRNAMTLSIGDGANDVAMIQEANVGCGLFGLEGSQAAMSADYAFGQFRFLTKLLLVHGRWSYQRVAEMHANFFYKNVVWTFGLFWYMPFNGFDATYLYHYTFILLCNLLFTSLPVVVMGAFDQDINHRAALAYPQLYVRGIRGLEYTRLKFWLYMLDGLYQSGVVFFIPYLVWMFGLAVSWNGKGIDSLADFGTTVAVAAIMSANLYVGLNTNYWTVLTWIVVFGSTIVMMAWIVIFSFFFSVDFIDEVAVLFGELTFWTTVVVTTLIALTPRFIIKYLATVYAPLDKDIVREMWVKGDLKDQLGLTHRNGKRRGASHNEQEPEAAPMFSDDLHARSLSELSTHQYEPANTSSPGTTPAGIPHATRQPYSDTTPPNEAEQGQYLYAPQPQQGASGHARARSPTSPNGSYYSVSELPPPSPLPSPKYRLPSGEITTTPPSRRSSVATTRASIRTAGRGQPMVMPSYDMPSSPPAPAGTLSPNSMQQHFEMQAVRSPPSAYPARPPSSAGHGGQSVRSASAASYASYATAPEGSFGHGRAEDVDMDAEMDLSGGEGPGHEQYYAQGYHQGELDVYGHGQDHDPNSRRASEISWDGPRAL